MLDAVVLALVLAPQPQVQAPTGRPATPYARPPAAGRVRAGHAPFPVAGADAAPQVAEPVTFEDDAVPLPVRATARAGAGGDALDAPAAGDPHFLGFVAGAHRPPPGEAVDALLWSHALPAYADGRPTPVKRRRRDADADDATAAVVVQTAGYGANSRDGHSVGAKQTETRKG